MRKFAIVAVGALLASAVLTGVASAQQYPSVANLQAFSAQTNYMSLPGYLRYLVNQQSGQWLTYQEASRVVQQQKGQ
jgi:hypothetical protein